MELKGKVALKTGAGSGIGPAFIKTPLRKSAPHRMAGGIYGGCSNVSLACQ